MAKRIAVFLAFVLTLAACGSVKPVPSGLPGGLLPKLADTGTSQIVLVVNDEPSSILATVHAFEEESPGKWKEVFGPIEATVGEAGFAPPGEKREGDKKSPSGIYELRRAFGYGPENTKIEYIQVTKKDVWVNDSRSPEYNTLAKRSKTKAASFEEMKRKDHLYKYGIVIEYNTEPAKRRRGSAIFFHVWRAPGKGTLGCVAMSEVDILKLIHWLDPEKKPKVAMGTRGDVLKLMEQ